MYLLKLFVPYNPKHRILLLKLPQIQKHSMGIIPLQKLHPVIQNRLQRRLNSALLGSKSLPGPGFCKPCHRADLPPLCFLYYLEFFSRVNAYLVNLLLPACILHVFPSDRILHPKCACRHLQMGKTVSLGISGNLIYPRPKGCLAAIVRYTSAIRRSSIIRRMSAIRRTSAGYLSHLRRILSESVQKLLYPLHLKRRAKITRKNLSLLNQPYNRLLPEAACLQVFLKRILLTDRDSLQKLLFIVSLSA